MEWLTTHWVEIGVAALALHTFLKALADAIDKNPDKENAFEKIVRIIGQVIAYLFGQRPK